MTPEDRRMIWQRQLEWYAQERHEAAERRKKFQERGEFNKRACPTLTEDDIKRAVAARRNVKP